MTWQKVVLESTGEEVEIPGDVLIVKDDSDIEIPREFVETVTKPRRGRPAKQLSSSSSDPVNSPAHYTAGGIETIDYIEAKQLNYHLGNVVKYVSRAGKKHELLEDLKKAKWYLDREIKRLENLSE